MTQTGTEILFDAEIRTTTKIRHNRPAIGEKKPGERKGQLTDIAIPQDHNIVRKMKRLTDI